MTAFIKFFFGWLTSGPLDRILETVDRKFEKDVDREKLRTDLAMSYVRAKTAVLTGPGWWFPLLVLSPVSFHFSAVCVYSVFWCSNCAFAQTWTIAALPAPMDEWEGMIILSQVLYGGGLGIASRLRS